MASEATVCRGGSTAQSQQPRDHKGVPVEGQSADYRIGLWSAVLASVFSIAYDIEQIAAFQDKGLP